MIRVNHMKVFLSAALLLAFGVPSGYAYSAYDNYSYGSSTPLAADVHLTQGNEKITLTLRDSDVKQVLRMFADKAGKNIIFHDSVKGKVTMDLVDMPINNAFELILQVAGLSYYDQNNTLIILAKNNSDNASFSKQEMMTFPVQYVSATKIADFLNKNVFGAKKAGLSGVDAATVNSATNEIIVFGMPSDAAIVRKVIAQFDKKPVTRTFAVNHTTPAEMADMICTMLLPSQGATAGGGSGKNKGYIAPEPGVGTGGAAGIVTGGAASSSSTEDLKLGEGVVACSVSNSSSGGFDLQNLSISYFPQRGTILMLGGSAAQQQLVQEFIQSNDVKQPQAYVEMSIVELNEQGSKEFQNIWSIQSEAWGVSFNGSRTTGGRVATPGDRYLPWTYSGWITSASAAPSYYEVSGKEKVADLYKGNSYISWTMNYLIENAKARILANPKIIVTNGKQSIIDLTEDYVEKVTSEYMSSSYTGTGSTGTVEKTYTIGDDKGLKIMLTPFISPDGYVTMNITPEYATEAGRVYSQNEAGENEIAATLLNRRNLELKNVRVKDGETLVIGGLIQEADQKVVNKIPVLGDLPVIGAAFRSSSTTKSKSELIIMITPKIIDDGEGSVADSL